MVILDSKIIKKLNEFQKGMRNSDGSSRNSKYMIMHNQINELSLEKISY